MTRTTSVRRIGRSLSMVSVTVALCLGFFPAEAGAVPVAAPAAALSAAPVTAASIGLAAGTTTKRVKFYVVRQSFQGEPEFLFEIAARFLGDGNRAKEIFDLNVGRQQEDGGRLTQADKIEPGWVLLLPNDAKGNQVQIGEIEVANATETPTPEATATAPAAEPKDDGGSALPVVLWIIGGLVLMLGLGLLGYALRGRGGDPEPAPLGRNNGGRPIPAPAPGPEPAPPAPRRLFGRNRVAAGPVPRRFDAAAAWTVDRALRSLAGLGAAAGRPLPSFYAVSLDADLLRLRLAAPDHEPPAPWSADQDGLGWSAPLRALQAVPLDEQIPAPSPRLVTLGNDGDTRVLVDLGQTTGLIAVEGATAGVNALLQGWITELDATPWADQVRVVVAGLEAPAEPGRSGRVEYVRGLREGLAATGTTAVGWAGGGSVAGVVRGGPTTGATVPGVLILAEGAGGPELEQVQALAGRPDAGWTVVVTGRVPAARWRFTLKPDGRLDTGVLGINVQVSGDAVAPAGR
jgi:hypothetical protein